MLVRRSVLQPYPASISTTPRGNPALQAASICSSAISGLVLKLISLGTPALRRRFLSAAHPAADRDDTLPADWRGDWQATGIPRLGSYPASRAARNIDAPHRPSALPSWENRCHQ